MLDPKILRESPELVRAAIAKKHLNVDLDRVLEIDVRFRAELKRYDEHQGELKGFSARIASRTCSSSTWAVWSLPSTGLSPFAGHVSVRKRVT